ncbi:hypothetical protein HELRODRAFT_194269 [Helobdella robusta]|uniref:VWFA domain-containing protein n=1 Tax=Helobdella robusta TaxID=6412 RepID=T1FVV8_HELRO|nr:hypothetical protein HELRODRAFT_194269 [Helobdella robusta]ESN92318.1 hypothetical protein HELRODRAFT_194269 [Helobdella robusta]
MDFDISSRPPCWVQTGGTFDFNNVVPNQPNVTNLRLETCTTASTSVRTILPAKSSLCWKSYQQTRYIGLQQISLNTITECQNYCFNEVACYVMDFDISSRPPCWVQTGGTFDFNNVVPNQPNVTNLRLETCTTASTTFPAKAGLCWKTYPQTLYVGLTQTNYASIKECQDYCYSFSACYLFNYDTSTQPPCWVQTTGSFNASNVLSGFPSLTNFRLETCTSSSTKKTSLPCVRVYFDKSSPGASSVATGLTALQCLTSCVTTSTNCAAVDFDVTTDCSFQFLNNTSSYGGRQANQINTLQECLRYCINTPSCLALDFNVQNECWIHTDLSIVVTNRIANSQVTQFVLNRVNCISQPSQTTSASRTASTTSISTACLLATFQNTNSYGGMLVDSINNSVSCLNYCLITISCVGADFNTASNQCFQHTDKNAFENTKNVNSPGIIQFVKNPNCGLSTSPVIDCLIATYQNTNSQGGAQVFGIFSSPICLSFCLSRPTCVGVDFDVVLGQCFIHSNKYQFETTRQMNSAQGVIQYVMSTNCTGVTTQSTTRPVTMFTSRQPLSCAPSFRIYFNSSSSTSATQQSQLDALQCMVSCFISSRTCVAVDFSPVRTCYSYNDRGQVESARRTLNFVNQYIVDRSCNLPLPYCSYQFFMSTSSVGAQQATQATDLQSCLYLCIATPTCVAVDFNAQNQCWWHSSTSAVTNNRMTNTDVSQFVLNRVNCDVLPPIIFTSSSSSAPVSISTSAPLSCAPSFRVYFNATSLGSNDLLPQLDAVQCITNCFISSTTCAAVDFKIGSGCWRFTDRNQVDATRTTNNLVTQFVAERSCALPLPFCSYQFFGGTSSYGAQLAQQINTLQDCLYLCITTTNCVAVDYNVQNQCWLHDNLTVVLQNRGINTESSQLVLNRVNCYVGPPIVQTSTQSGIVTQPQPCQPSFRIFFNSTSSGSTDFLPQLNTTIQCITNCFITSAACAAVDFRTDNLGCSRFTNRFQVDATRTANNFVTQFVAERSCALPFSFCSYQFYSGTSSYGAQLAQQINSLQDCLYLCIVTLNCVALDYNVQNQCWWHSDRNVVTNNRGANPESSQFVLNRVNCVVPLSSAQTTTESQVVTQPQPCAPSFRVYFNATSPGSNDLLPQLDAVQCITNCFISSTACAAVDFRIGSGCWRFTDRNQVDATRTTNNLVTQFVAERSCALPLPFCSYQFYSGTSSYGAQLAQQINSLQDCLYLCIVTLNCVALDYNVQNQCWWHSDRNAVTNNRGANPESSQFVLNRVNCLVTPPILSTTTQRGVSTQSQTCPPSFRVYFNSTTFGSVSQQPQYNALQCITNCFIASTTCVAAEYSDAICSFQFNFNVSSYGAQLANQISSLQDCLYLCINTPNCVAVDYNILNQCWIHNNINVVLSNQDTNPDASQFILNRVNCATVSVGTTLSPATTPSVLRTSTRPYTINPNFTCVDWVKLVQTRAANHIYQSQFRDLNSCLNGCYLVSRCVAVDVGASNSDCYFIYDVNDDNYDLSFTQYQIQRQCYQKGPIPGQCQNYQQNVNQNSVNGRLYFQYTTVPACKDLCFSIPTCVAFDFNTNTADPNFGCWLHLDQYDLASINTFVANGIDQYILSRDCTGSCFYTWNLYVDNGLSGGIPQRDTTVQGCQQRCINNPTCTGIDIDTNPNHNFCWLHFTTDLFLFPTSGVSHYQISRSASCPESPGCYVRSLISMNADGGQRYPDPVSNETCALQCLQLYPQCVAADWSISDRTCYLHNSFSGRKPSPCCNRYEITCTSTNPAICQDDFIVLPSFSPNLQYLNWQSNIFNLNDCKTSCLSFGKGCIGVVFSQEGRVIPGVSTCYLVTSIDAMNTSQRSNDFDLYSRSSCEPYNSAMLTRTCLLDVVFLVDTSGSILDNQPPGLNNMQLIRSFLESFLQSNLKVGPFFDHIGLITFDTNARIAYDLCDNQVPYSINASGIMKIRQSLGITNTPAAYDLAYDMLFGSGRCGRAAAQPIIVLITDGHTSPEYREFFAASLAKLVYTRSVRIAIGVTTDVNPVELQQFDSEDIRGIPILDDFSQLFAMQGVIYNFMAQRCNRPTVATVPIPTRSFTSFSASTSTTTATTTTTTTTTTATATISTSARQIISTMSYAQNNAFAFNAYLTQSIQGPQEWLRFDQSTLSLSNSYLSNANGFVSPGPEGLFFIDLGAAVSPGRKLQIDLIVGPNQQRFLNWESTSQNGLITVSRFAVMYLQSGLLVGFKMPAYDSYLQSDSSTRYGSFSGFSIAHAMTYDANRFALVAVPNVNSFPIIGENYTIPLRSVVSSLSNNLVNGNTYVCPINGVYVVTFSAGVVYNKKLQLSISGLDPTIDLSRLGTNRNGLTSVSRTSLVKCQQGQQIYFKLLSGQIDDINLTAFSIFQYKPQYVSEQSWGVYKSYNSDTRDNFPLDPFYFDTPLVNDQGLYDGGNNIVRIQISGYYYVQITAGSQTGFNVRMRLVRVDGRTGAQNAQDFISHGSIVLLRANDFLKVVADIPSYLYNTIYGYQTSFIGFLIYPE